MCVCSLRMVDEAELHVVSNSGITTIPSTHRLRLSGRSIAKAGNLCYCSVLKPSSCSPYHKDFGKAQKGKSTFLPKKKLKCIKKEHPQVAPDLRDGLIQQSQATDIFPRKNFETL